MKDSPIQKSRLQLRGLKILFVDCFRFFLYAKRNQLRTIRLIGLGIGLAATLFEFALAYFGVSTRHVAYSSALYLAMFLVSTCHLWLMPIGAIAMHLVQPENSVYVFILGAICISLAIYEHYLVLLLTILAICLGTLYQGNWNVSTLTFTLPFFFIVAIISIPIMYLNRNLKWQQRIHQEEMAQLLTDVNRYLHDTALADLSSSLIALRELQDSANLKVEQQARLDSQVQRIEGACTKLRALIRYNNDAPSSLTFDRFVAAYTSRLKQARISLNLTQSLPDQPHHNEMLLFQVLQELLNNVEKHAARPSACSMEITEMHDAYYFSITNQIPDQAQVSPAISSGLGLRLIRRLLDDNGGEIICRKLDDNWIAMGSILK